MVVKAFPKESEELIKWGIKAYTEYASENLELLRFEKNLFNVIAPQIRQRGYFTKEEGEIILSWRTPVVPRFYSKNSEDIVQRFSLQAFSTKDPVVAIQILTLLHGVSFKSASKFFAVLDPKKYCVFYEEVWNILVQWNFLKTEFSNSPLAWEEYLQGVHSFATRYKITAQEVEKSLLSLHNKYKLRKNSINHIPLDNFFS